MEGLLFREPLKLLENDQMFREICAEVADPDPDRRKSKDQGVLDLCCLAYYKSALPQKQSTKCFLLTDR